MFVAGDTGVWNDEEVFSTLGEVGVFDDDDNDGCEIVIERVGWELFLLLLC